MQHQIVWPARQLVDGERLIIWARDEYVNSRIQRGQSLSDEQFDALMAEAEANVTDEHTARGILDDSGKVTFGREPGAPQYDPLSPEERADRDGTSLADEIESEQEYCNYAAQ